jgi:hypothetical protein
MEWRTGHRKHEDLELGESLGLLSWSDDFVPTTSYHQGREDSLQPSTATSLKKEMVT